ncbi:MAG: MBL fold metallo-hydrolase [Chloroflexi bacterium]|nr:MBL fold metallo-hydrolase [Chloroflexota bacterium]MBV9896701.1 MBL fold metallo-hydrolase [Chloroflexota bacterium]
MAIVHRASPLRIGPLTIQPVSDGAILQMPPASIFKDAASEEWQPHVPLNAHGNIELALTCLLVRVGDRRILVDTGFGPRPDRPEVGLLAQSLAEVGVSAEDVDTVVLSHPHGDHVGGTVLGAGEAATPAYPKARYWLGKADWEHGRQPGAPVVEVVQEKIAPLHAAQRLDLADGEQEIAPGVRLLPLPGHTPGHMGVAFTAGQETAVYVGDLVHHALQIDHPEWSPVFDSLPQLSRETRQALVERARREGALVLSYHLPFPGIGRITNAGWEAVAG